MGKREMGNGKVRDGSVQNVVASGREGFMGKVYGEV